MVKDKSFGPFVRELREKRNINLEVLCEGLCDAGKMSRIENGKVEVEKLLRDRLLGRLGVAPENYENFLYYSEYQEWKERQDIVHCILHDRLEEAEQRLVKFKSRDLTKRPLEYQFYLAMQAQIQRKKGAGEEELGELFRRAVQLTIPEGTGEELTNHCISVEEVNLLVEDLFYHQGQNIKNNYEKMICYVEHLSLDTLAMAKIYPKIVYYLYQVWQEDGFGSKQEISKMLRLCNKAIEVLQNGRRMFYLWELLAVKEQLLQSILEDIEKNGAAGKQLLEWKQTCVNWRTALEEVYKEYNISKETQDFCYLYVDMEAHCIGDVIRMRRKMFGMTMQQLSEGICSERTISRLERNVTEPQREIVRLLFKRLHMAAEFCRNDLLTEDPEAKKLFGELKQSNNKNDCEKAEKLLNEISSRVSLEIPENKQAVRRVEIISEWNKQKREKESIDKRFFVEQLKEALGYTIPYEIAVAEGEKYLTQNELSCLQNILNRLDWTYPEMRQCVEALYHLFEEQRAMKECFGMYEFVMGIVASKLGNKGEYDYADAIGLKILKNTLIYRKLGNIYEEMYSL